jgi:ElaA protein
MQFHWRRFDELGAGELYAMLALRQSILVVEQASPYPDLDFVDQAADHLLATDGGTLVGYGRCHAPLPGNTHASFGRLVVARSYRRTGLGKELVSRLIARLAHDPCRDLRIGAQLYLEDFYARFGFARHGAPYDDAGVPHIEMRLHLGSDLDR